MRDETGWLIEMSDKRYPIQWWIGPDARSGFTADSNQAMRFARKSDAERTMRWVIANCTEYSRSLVVTEHLWSPVKLGAKEWKCGECGYMNTANICTKCGGIFE